MISKFIFGSSCLNCKKESNGIICTNCKKVLDEKFLNEEDSNLKVCFEYEGLTKKLIMNGKYSFNKRIWHIWDEYLREVLKNINLKGNIVVSYPPMTWRRYCFRGFNQAKILAEMVGDFLGADVLKVCKRVKFDKSASLMGRLERLESMRGAFEKIKDIDEYDTLILVDDVLTTGATLKSLEEEIGFKGKVIWVCLASGRKFGSL